MTEKGFPPERFQYPDVMAAVRKLLQVGATVNDFVRAYERVVRTKGHHRFSASYLTKAVQSDIDHQQKTITNTANVHKPRQKLTTAYESDFKNCKHLAGDIVKIPPRYRGMSFNDFHLDYSAQSEIKMLLEH